MSKLKQPWSNLRGSFWFFPSLIVHESIALAVALIKARCKPSQSHGQGRRLVLREQVGSGAELAERTTNFPHDRERFESRLISVREALGQTLPADEQQLDKDESRVENATGAAEGANQQLRSKVLHNLFIAGIWLKGIDGILEMVGGALVIFTTRAALGRLVADLTQYELAEDPTDWVANHLRQPVSHLSNSTRVFSSIYLLGHGAIKVFLVWGGLLRHRLWAFPTAMAFIGAFICYQVYRIINQFSVGLSALTVIDLAVLALIFREYRTVKTGQKL